MAEKLWNGRFAEKTDRLVERFTSSIAIDSRLYHYDIEGSIAHCRTLAKAGVISEDEAATLIQGLGVINREIEHGEFQFDDSLEDIHMHIEARLLQKVGKVAQKLHTARSRNDQVILDVRLFLRDMTKKILSQLNQLRGVIIESAKRNIDVIMPGYTHLQRAQPVLVAHHMLAYYEMFGRDKERLADCLKRINVMPLGSAALAGTGLPIDREFVANELGFPTITANSMDTVGDRDFAVEFVASCSLIQIHLSRLSEELVLLSSEEFSFITLADSFCTGSSIMPQKKNPDVLELVRANSGTAYGNLIALLTTMKGLPLSYNRDLQLDKLSLFSSLAR